MAQVELHHVVKSYDGKSQVLHGIDLTISDGQFVVLVGPSGCGKSTLLRMIAGLESVTQGDILIDGVRINDLPPRDRDIAMVFQDYALYPHKTLFENMAFGLRLRKEPEAVIQQRVMDAARLLKATGQQHKVDELVTAMNRAAEAAVPMSKKLLTQSIQTMSVQDALNTPGAMLFVANNGSRYKSIGHVAISVGNGHDVVEGVDVLITHTFGLDQVEDALNAPRLPGALKPVVEPNGKL